ncbi:hypothetical protein PN466_11230 [Roseofilum reptotaenium CS-1145]|nr:hypothetical protein [Roseofilum reptotaenium CS-1145]
MIKSWHRKSWGRSHWGNEGGVRSHLAILPLCSLPPCTLASTGRSLKIIC